MRRVTAATVVLFSFLLSTAGTSQAGQGGAGSCFNGFLARAITCGGGYVIPGSTPAPAPPSTPASPAGDTHHTPARYSHYTPPPPPLVPRSLVVRPPPAGACATKITSTAAGGAQVYGVAPSCPVAPRTAPAGAAPAVPRPVPVPPRGGQAALAVAFWKTIALPVPSPSVPPGYAITGMPSYLVTAGTTDPAPYRQDTPLGALTLTAHGSYMVDWGDAPTPEWQGPYPAEGEPWPAGKIVHTYDFVGTYIVTVVENWTATWTLGGASGTLAGLETTATIPGFTVDQLQAVITSG
ncbi:MAG: hypothetical protein ACRDYY_02125 [Acidimicrobiales bacterium]